MNVSPVRHFLSIVILPIGVLVLLPFLLVHWAGPLNIGWSLQPPLGVVVSLGGIALVAAGFLLLVVTVRQFVHYGEGTLAPWDPTQQLVVEGIYRHMRNPMHVGVFLALYGEGVLMGSVTLLLFATAFVILHLFYIPLFEERGLEERFGDAYLEYKRNVPRWIPRIDPWDAGGSDPTIKG